MAHRVLRKLPHRTGGISAAVALAIVSSERKLHCGPCIVRAYSCHSYLA
jgi:hypothetical protein